MENILSKPMSQGSTQIGYSSCYKKWFIVAYNTIISIYLSSFCIAVYKPLVWCTGRGLNVLQHLSLHSAPIVKDIC